MAEIDILQSFKDDAGEILKLQKICYLSEAKIIDDYTIPPLHQAQAEIDNEYSNYFFLKAVYKDKIIGSVRGYSDNKTAFIGKLIVDEEFQNQGIGTRLLSEIENTFASANRYELFTGERSEKNLYLYGKNGYKLFKKEKISEKLTLVYLEKFK